MQLQLKTLMCKKTEGCEERYYKKRYSIKIEGAKNYQPLPVDLSLIKRKIVKLLLIIFTVKFNIDNFLFSPPVILISQF